MKNKCIVCNRRGKLLFKDNQGFLKLCENCYKNLTKEEKLKIECHSGEEKVSGLLGFLVGGIIGYIIVRNSGKHERRKQHEQFHITERDLDKMSIEKFNAHYGLLSGQNQDFVNSKLMELKKNEGLLAVMCNSCGCKVNYYKGETYLTCPNCGKGGYL